MAFGLTNTWQRIDKLKQTGTNFTIHQTRQERLMNACSVWQSHKGGELKFSVFFLFLSCINLVSFRRTQSRVSTVQKVVDINFVGNVEGLQFHACNASHTGGWSSFLSITLLNPNHPLNTSHLELAQVLPLTWWDPVSLIFPQCNPFTITTILQSMICTLQWSLTFTHR